MSFWKLLGALALWEWLDGPDRKGASRPPRGYPHDCGREDAHFDKIHSLESRIEELERQQDKCDICSDRYDELQDEIDDLQDEIDELQDELDDAEDEYHA